MLGPCIMMASTPFSVGYAIAAVRAPSHGRLAVAAVILSVLEAVALLWMLLQATT
jgi:hypothetical protein